MQIKSAFSFAFLAATAVAVPNQAATQDLATISAVMGKVGDAITQLVTVFKAFDGDITKTEPILKASENILSTLKSGAQQIQSTTAIGILDAVGILAPVQTLNSKVDEIVAVLKDKKPLLDEKQLAPVVLDQLQQQVAATDQLVQAITGKLPSLVQPIASPISGQITTKLSQLVQLYGGSAGSGGAAAAPAPAASAPKAAAPKGKGTASPKVTAPKRTPAKGTKGVPRI